MPALVAEDVDEMLRPSWVSAREGRRARVGERERSSREGGGGRAGARWGWAAPHTRRPSMAGHRRAAEAAAQAGTRAAQSPPLQDPGSCAPPPQEGQRSIRPLARTRTRRQLWYVCGPS